MQARPSSPVISCSAWFISWEEGVKDVEPQAWISGSSKINTRNVLNFMVCARCSIALRKSYVNGEYCLDKKQVPPVALHCAIGGTSVCSVVIEWLISVLKTAHANTLRVLELPIPRRYSLIGQTNSH